MKLKYSIKIAVSNFQDIRSKDLKQIIGGGILSDLEYFIDINYRNSHRRI